MEKVVEDNQSIDDFNSFEEIDLNQLFYNLIRYKKLISVFTIAGFLVGGLVSLVPKRTWEGQFQIVLEDNNELPTRSINGLAQLTGFGLSNSQDKLLTEVEILKSPSILMNIYDYVKAKKTSIYGESSVKKLKFLNWKDRLKINLKKNTSVLNISYRDEDKDLIIPVLKKISKTYQNYSGKSRNRGIELGIDFYEQQINFYKDKSFKSTIDANKYGESKLILLEKNENNTLLPYTTNIETAKYMALKQLRQFDKIQAELDDIEDDPLKHVLIGKKIQMISSTDNDFASNFNVYSKGDLDKIGFLTSDILTSLEDLNNRIEIAKDTYQDNDILIKKLIKERNLKNKMLKNSIKNFIEIGRATAKSNLKSSEINDDVLTKYKQLVDIALKDKGTLLKLEDGYRELLLEKAREQDPWELITDPTLMPNPVSPRRKVFALIGLFIGLLSSAVYAVIKENIDGIIFSKNQLKSLTPSDLLVDLNLEDIEKLKEKLKILFNYYLDIDSNSIAILIIGDIKQTYIENLNKYIKSISNKIEITITKDILKAGDYSNLFLLTSLGVTSKKDILDFVEELNLLKKPLSGVLILNKTLDWN